MSWPEMVIFAGHVVSFNFHGINLDTSEVRSHDSARHQCETGMVYAEKTVEERQVKIVEK
jgi:hypothetical protein